MSKTINFERGRIDYNNSAGKNELYFYGDIVSSEWDVWSSEDKCPQSVADLLKEIANDSELNIYINSGGGDVHAGIAIYSQLKRRSGKNIVHIDGLAASIASVIAMAGDEIRMSKSAQFMIHKPWSACWGNADEMRKTAEVLDICQQSIMDIYMDNVAEGIDRATIENMMNSETWLTGEQAAQYFNIDVYDAPAVAACVSDYFKHYKNMPQIKITDKHKDDAAEIEIMRLKLKLI